MVLCLLPEPATQKAEPDKAKLSRRQNAKLRGERYGEAMAFLKRRVLRRWAAAVVEQQAALGQVANLGAASAAAAVAANLAEAVKEKAALAARADTQ